MSAYLRPESLEEALEARAAHPDWMVLAGGTDLMVGVIHRPPPPGMIDLFGLDALVGIEEGQDTVRIGAATTYAQLLENERIRELFPALHACCGEIGAVQIQERGTLGGNIANSSPVGDTLPVLLALDAELLLASPAGERRVPYHGFCTGYRRIGLKADELIVAVELPRPAPGTRQFWRKVGTRRAQAISKVMVAAAARLEDGVLRQARLAMGAVADRPVRLAGCEALLEGARPDAALAGAVRAKVLDEITPISDVRSTAAYRGEVAARLAARFVHILAEAAS